MGFWREESGANKIKRKILKILPVCNYFVWNNEKNCPKKQKNKKCSKQFMLKLARIAYFISTLSFDFGVWGQAEIFAMIDWDNFNFE